MRLSGELNERVFFLPLEKLIPTEATKLQEHIKARPPNDFQAQQHVEQKNKTKPNSHSTHFFMIPDGQCISDILELSN